MTIFARSLARLARSDSRRLTVRPLTGFAIAALLALAAAAPAGAVVTEVSGTTVGLQPRSEALGEGEPATFGDESGNAVQHGTSVYAVYWDPGKRFHHEWLVKIDGFFHDLGEAGLGTGFADLGQYRDRTNAITPFQALYKGSYSDTAKYPTGECTDPHPEAGSVTCLTDAQLREQLQSFISSHGLPKGMHETYYLLTPPGVTVCLDASATHCSDYTLSAGEAKEFKYESVSYEDSFCSYHAAINPDNATEGDGNTVLYAAVPWTAGKLGGALPTAYQQGYNCQDGGWNPEKGEENREKATEPTKEEEEILKEEKGTPEEREELVERRRLEGPHQQEPNQEGKGEEGGYTPGLSDLIINQIAEEQMNIVTDPMLNGWKDAEGKEVTDECRDVFGATAGPSGGEIAGSVTADEKTEAGSLSNVGVGAGRYYINNIFSVAEGTCDGGVGLVARFTAPNPVNANEIVGFDGMESTVSLIRGNAFGPSGPPTTTYATFGWNFGDGTPEVKGFAPGAPLCEAPWLSPCAASAFHAYQYGGTYTVTLTVTDVAGNLTSVAHELTVAGPPAPAQRRRPPRAPRKAQEKARVPRSSTPSRRPPSCPARCATPCARASSSATR